MCILNIIVCTYQMHMTFVHTHTFVPSQTPVWGRPTQWSHVCWVCLLHTVQPLHSPARPTGWEQQPTPHVKHAWSFTSCSQPWYTAVPARIQYYLYVRLKAHVHMHTNKKCCRWVHVYIYTQIHSIELRICFCIQYIRIWCSLFLVACDMKELEV